MTLLRALTCLYNHTDKKQAAQFTITFDDVTRNIVISKRWGKLSEDWIYTVKESYCPRYVYNEKQIISAIAGISGISLVGNIVKFNISEISFFSVQS